MDTALRLVYYAWSRLQMNIFSALLALCAGNSPVTGQRPVTLSFDVSFDLCPNKRLSKQSWGWWFETPSRLLWRHCNGKTHVAATVLRSSRGLCCIICEVITYANMVDCRYNAAQNILILHTALQWLRQNINWPSYKGTTLYVIRWSRTHSLLCCHKGVLVSSWQVCNLVGVGKTNF